MRSLQSMFDTDQLIGHHYERGLWQGGGGGGAYYNNQKFTVVPGPTILSVRCVTV